MNEPTILERLQHWNSASFDQIGLQYTDELIRKAAETIVDLNYIVSELLDTEDWTLKELKGLNAQYKKTPYKTLEEW